MKQKIQLIRQGIDFLLKYGTLLIAVVEILQYAKEKLDGIEYQNKTGAPGN